MKRLIFQVYIPIEGKSTLYDFCIKSVEEYCAKHNIDHIVLKEPILKICPDMKRTDRNKNGLIKLSGGYLPIMEKSNALTYLKQYDQVAVIDADIYIRSDSPNIFDELGDNHFAGVLERDLPLTSSHKRKIVGYSNDMFKKLTDVDWNWNDKGAEFMNMGVMVFNKSFLDLLNGDDARTFLTRKEFKNFVDGVGLFKYSTDQVLYNYFLKKSNARVKFLEWKWNALYRGVEDSKIKEAYFVHFFLKKQMGKKADDINHIRKSLGIK